MAYLKLGSQLGAGIMSVTEKTHQVIFVMSSYSCDTGVENNHIPASPRH